VRRASVRAERASLARARGALEATTAPAIP